MSSEGVLSPEIAREMERKAYRIAKELFRGIYIPTREEEEEEEETATLTSSNLRNMLAAARDAKDKRSWDLFQLKAIYIARRAKREDALYRFVRGLLATLLKEESDEVRRLELAEKTLIASIYVFNAIRAGLRDLVYGGR